MKSTGVFGTEWISRFGIVAAVLVIWGLLCPLQAFSHSLYIQSGRYSVEKGKVSPMFFCYGHHFPVDDGVRFKKLRHVKVISPEGDSLEIELRNERTLHSYEVKYKTPGTYVLIAETNPGLFAMYTDKKGRSRHSLKPKHTWVENADTIKSSMRSSQWSKTYVTCEKGSEKFPANVGLLFELVPTRDISELKEGGQLELEVYLNGAPYTGEGTWDATYGGFSTEAEDMFIPRIKLRGGKFTVPLEHGGRWFVRYFTKTDADPKNRSEYLTEKRTATLTFIVRNERRRPQPTDH